MLHTHACTRTHNNNNNNSNPSPPPHPSHAQVDVARRDRDGLSGSALGSLVYLPPGADAAALPPTVDLRRVAWPLNPFGGLPAGEALLGRVTEVQLTDAASGASVPLPQEAGPGVPLVVSMPAGER